MPLDNRLPLAPLAAEQVVCRRGARVVLNRVSLHVDPGEVVGLVGANGAGKSSLLAALAGQLPLAAGSIQLGDRNLASFGRKSLARVISVVPQHLPSAGSFTVYDVALMGRYPYVTPFRSETADDHRIAQRALRRTGVLHLRDRHVSTLSGGERQLVFIARALAQNPRFLLLDEPTANLDWRHQAGLLRLVSHLTKRGVGVIAALHDLELASRHCDRLVLLAKGEVLTIGRPEQVLTAPHLESAFGVRARVLSDPTGPGVVLRATAPPANQRSHKRIECGP